MVVLLEWMERRKRHFGGNRFGYLPLSGINKCTCPSGRTGQGLAPTEYCTTNMFLDLWRERICTRFKCWDFWNTTFFQASKCLTYLKGRTCPLILQVR